MTTRMPAQRCPTCGATLDAATCVDREGPAPSRGDLTVCGYCLRVLRFGAGFVLAEVNLDELEQTHPEEVAQIRKMIELTHRFKRSMQEKGKWPAEKPGRSN